MLLVSFCCGLESVLIEHTIVIIHEPSLGLNLQPFRYHSFMYHTHHTNPRVCCETTIGPEARGGEAVYEKHQLIKTLIPIGRSRTLLRPRASGTEEYEDDQDEDRSPSGPSAHHYRRVHPSSLQSECIMQKCADQPRACHSPDKCTRGTVGLVSGWFY